jgi:prolyl 4-hydroxylase
VCPIDINERSAWYAPNDLNEMFLSILQQNTYNVTVLSRPSAMTAADENTDDMSLSDDAPWVLQMDDFLSAEEADTLIQLGADIGYSRSKTGTGAQDADGQHGRQVSRFRTSTNAWCDTEACNDHPFVQTLYERIYNLTKLPSDNSESLQLLRYEVGQFYKVHHDFIDIEVQRQHGVRIFTFFFYLNTMDENGGGGTNFPRLNLTVHPVVGRALLFSQRPESCTEHQRQSHRTPSAGRGAGCQVWCQCLVSPTPSAVR